MLDKQNEINDAEIQLITEIAYRVWQFLQLEKAVLVNEAIENRIRGALLKVAKEVKE